MRKWMKQTIAILTLVGMIPGASDALGFRHLGVSVGLDLTQTNALAAPATMTGTGTSFDSARLAVGGFLNLGEFFIDHLDFVPGMDLVLQDDLNIYSFNVDTRYRFYRGEGVTGYFGAGVGVHLFRPDTPSALLRNETKGSLNIPIGFQRRLGTGLGWFGELKLVIADSQTDSSFRFSVGLLLGGT
ncbi:MAG: hypothetical protein CME26_12220 [Gemmatimonadetes bacterium]|nr:hypothetical protein [Gemmatimonadota bacterium]